MADADKFIIKCHASPQVFIDGSSDAVGKFTLHEDSGNKSGEITILGTEATGEARWWYEARRTVGGNDTALIHTGQSFTDGVATPVVANDIVMGVYIRHTGETPNGEVCAHAITIAFNNANQVGPQGPSIMLLPGESIALRLANTAEGQSGSDVKCQELLAETGSSSDSADSDKAAVEVLAFIDDV